MIIINDASSIYLEGDVISASELLDVRFCLMEMILEYSMCHYIASGAIPTTDDNDPSVESALLNSQVSMMFTNVGGQVTAHIVTVRNDAGTLVHNTMRLAAPLTVIENLMTEIINVMVNILGISIEVATDETTTTD